MAFPITRRGRSRLVFASPAARAPASFCWALAVAAEEGSRGRALCRGSFVAASPLLVGGRGAVRLHLGSIFVARAFPGTRCPAPFCAQGGDITGIFVLVAGRVCNLFSVCSRFLCIIRYTCCSVFCCHSISSVSVFSPFSRVRNFGSFSSLPSFGFVVPRARVFVSLDFVYGVVLLFLFVFPQSSIPPRAILLGRGGTLALAIRGVPGQRRSLTGRCFSWPCLNPTFLSSGARPFSLSRRRR